MLAVATNNGFVNLVDGRTLRILDPHPRGPPPLDRQRHVRAGRPDAGGHHRPGGLGFYDSRDRRWLKRPEIVGKWGWSLFVPQFSADGRWLAVDGNDHLVRLWDARRHVEVQTRKFSVLPRDLAMRPDGKVIAVPAEWGQGTGRVEILAVPSLERVARIRRRRALDQLLARRTAARRRRQRGACAGVRRAHVQAARTAAGRARGDDH